jgi:hypothetical protein
MTATLLCNGRDDAECMEPCIEGYTRRSKGEAHVVASYGASRSSDTEGRELSRMRMAPKPWIWPRNNALLLACARTPLVGDLENLVDMLLCC